MSTVHSRSTPSRSSRFFREESEATFELCNMDFRIDEFAFRWLPDAPKTIGKLDHWEDLPVAVWQKKAFLGDWRTEPCMCKHEWTGKNSLQGCVRALNHPTKPHPVAAACRVRSHSTCRGPRWRPRSQTFKAFKRSLERLKDAAAASGERVRPAGMESAALLRGATVGTG